MMVGSDCVGQFQRLLNDLDPNGNDDKVVIYPAELTRPKHTLNSTDYKDQNALMDYWCLPQLQIETPHITAGSRIRLLVVPRQV